MKKISHLLNVLHYAGVTKKDWQLLKKEIQQENSTMLQYASAAIIVYLAVLCLVFELQPSNVHSYQLLYRTCFVFIVIYHFIFLHFKKVLTPYSTIAWYVLMIFFLGYGILLGTVVQTSAPATVFCVLLVALPFWCIDYPVHSIFAELLAVFVFMTLSISNKEPAIWKSDLINSTMFFLLSSGITLYSSRLRITNLINTQIANTKIKTDEMTGLLTKNAIQREVQSYLNLNKSSGALIVIDLDYFKSINDTYGHKFGDNILCKAAENMRQAFPITDCLARFGGDEFVVFMKDVTEDEVVSSRLDYFKSLMEPKKTQTEADSHPLPEQFPIQQSIGIAMVQDNEEDYDSLFKRADEALYFAKRNGRNCYCFAPNTPK